MKDASIRISVYKSSDKTALLTLIDLNTPEYFAPSEKSDFDLYLDNAIELYYVIRFEDIIVGCGGINFQNNKSIGVISWDIIHPEYQGKSFGKQLLEFRLSELKKIESVLKIIVRTSQSTSVFYQKQGFEVKEIVPNYWAEGFDLYLMVYLEMD